MERSAVVELSRLRSLANPAVSVIIPAYNTADYIAETLDSVFAQTFQNFEVIVINDGSPDTAALELRLRPYLERVLYLKQQNRGPGSARNLGIHHARGEYLAFLDGDDCWLPEYLAEQIKLFDDCPSLAMACSDTRLFGDTPFANRTFWQLYPPRIPATFERLLAGDSSIVTSCTIARTESIREAGLFDENFIRAEDLDLWLRVAHRGGNVAIQRKVLGRRRVHSGALTASDAKVQWDEARVLQKLQRLLPLTPSQSSALQRRLARVQAYMDLERGKGCLLSGNSIKAQESLSKAYGYFHTLKLRLVLRGLRVAPRFTIWAAKVWAKCLERVVAYKIKVA